MNYYSTRDHQHIVSAAQAIACGLAPDGGLFVPEALPEVSAQQLQALWTQFYRTLEIQARHNEKGRMTHCPKRFWADMVEMRGEL